MNHAVNNDEVGRFFEQDIRTAEEAVRHQVGLQSLTQRQFDALVSYVFNRGAGNARPVLREVNIGNFARAAATIQFDDAITVHRAGTVTRVRLPGLTARRRREADDVRTR